MNTYNNQESIIASPNEILYDWSLDKMLQVDFNGDQEAFPKIRETLTRIGVASRGSKTLTQTCHILHKAGKYYVVHFLEIYHLNGRSSTLTIGDVARRNRIASLLQKWGLCTIVEPTKFANLSPMSDIKIVKASERNDWTFIAKQQLGNKIPVTSKKQ